MTKKRSYWVQISSLFSRLKCVFYSLQAPEVAVLPLLLLSCFITWMMFPQEALLTFFIANSHSLLFLHWYLAGVFHVFVVIPSTLFIVLKAISSSKVISLTTATFPFTAIFFLLPLFSSPVKSNPVLWVSLWSPIFVVYIYPGVNAFKMLFS